LNAPHAGESILATLVSAEGSSYRRPGARLLLAADGSRLGSISGGCLEEDLAVRARAVASTGRAELAVYDTTSENDLLWGVGLGCHGIVHVLLEKISPQAAWIPVLAANLRARRPTELVVVWRAGSSLLLGTHLASETSSASVAAVYGGCRT